MRSQKNSLFAYLIPLLFIFGAVCVSRAEEADLKQIAATDSVQRKTLNRRFDLIVAPCSILQSLQGQTLDSMRLYRFRDGQWEPVPFQFDERTPGGSKVLPDEGPEANPQDGNRTLDPQDELIFMAHDTGDRVPGGKIPTEVDRWIEIHVEDPSTRQKAWCYLFFYKGEAPPPTGKRYVQWDWDAKGFEGYLGRSDNYWIEGIASRKGGRVYKQIDPHVWRTPAGAGGTNENYFDHLKWVVEVRLMFGSVKLHFDTSDFTADLLAMRRGPVRCTSRVWTRIGLPMGLKGPKFVADIYSWEFCGASGIARLHVPVNPGVFVTNIQTRMGNDYSKGAYGMLWFNSNNREGFLVDGVMSPMEKKQNNNQDQWRMIAGPQGAVMNRSSWSLNFVEQANYVKAVWVDDVNALDPFEFDPGQHAGYSISEVSSIRSGDYDLSIDWYTPPHVYDPESDSVNFEIVNEFLNIVDHPLILEAEGRQAHSLIRPEAIKTKIKDD